MRAAHFLALAGLGCTGFDLTRPAAAPAIISIRIEVAHDSLSRVGLLGSVNAGRDVNGGSFQIKDSVLYVDGIALHPDENGATPGLLQYRWLSPANSLMTVPAPLTLTLPVVGDQDQLTAFTFDLPARLDPLTISSDTAGDIHLRVSPMVAPAGFEAVFAHWTVTVLASCKGGPALLRVDGSGPYPSDIRLARHLISSTNESEVSLCFRADAFYRVSTTTVTKTISVGMRVEWRLPL